MTAGLGEKVVCHVPVVGGLGVLLCWSQVCPTGHKPCLSLATSPGSVTEPRTQPNLATEAVLSTPQAPLGMGERGHAGQLWPLKDSIGRKLAVLGNPWGAPF